MQSANVSSLPFFPRGAFQKAFFIFGLFAAAYFSYERAIELSAPVSAVHVTKKSKAKSALAQFANSFGKTESFPLVAAPVAVVPAVNSTALNLTDSQVPAPNSEIAPALAGAAASAIAADGTTPVDAANPDAPVVEDLNAPLIHPGVAYTGPAATDFIDHSAVQPAKQIEDPAALMDLPIGNVTPKSVTSSGGSIYTPGSVSTASTTPVSNLTSQDFALISSRPFTTVVDEGQDQVRGATCTQDNLCTQNVNATLYGSRWDKTHGIKNTGASFSAQSTSGAIPIQFALHFLIQPSMTSMGADVSVDLTLVPTEANVSEQTTGGVSYKTYEFTFDDQAAASEHLRQVKLVLVYQKAAAATSYALSTATSSEFSFARSGFDTLSTPWAAGNTNSNSGYFKPDSQTFTFKIQ